MCPHPIGHDARNGVGRAAGRERHDERDRNGTERIVGRERDDDGSGDERTEIAILIMSSSQIFYSVIGKDDSPPGNGTGKGQFAVGRRRFNTAPPQNEDVLALVRGAGGRHDLMSLLPLLVCAFSSTSRSRSRHRDLFAVDEFCLKDVAARSASLVATRAPLAALWCERGSSTTEGDVGTLRMALMPAVRSDT